MGAQSAVATNAQNAAAFIRNAFQFVWNQTIRFTGTKASAAWISSARHLPPNAN